ncbi:MAG: prepilin-type N-terminal cleavage/methylation domain-containing protein [Nitrospinota bacterium]
MKLLKKTVSNNQGGFTLLELILALAIVAIIVAFGLGGVRLGITARDAGEKKADVYQRLRIITEHLTQKLQSTYPVFVSQKDGVPIEKGHRIMAFDGDSKSLRFVTFASPITATDQGSWIHEVKFYTGKHPDSEKQGLILMEKEISQGDIFSRIIPKEETTQYFLLAEDVTELKLRYYQVKKLQPSEIEDTSDSNSPTHSGEWVNRIAMDPFQVDQETPTNPTLAFEKANKISLPRAVEISIGITPKMDEENAEKEEDSETFFSAPIVVLLNSGMEIAVPKKKEKENDKA